MWIPNPTTRGGRVPIEMLTDRAKRYRAQATITQPERRCIYCGAPPARGRRLDVEHINGREDDSSPANLAYACRSCNTRKGAWFALAGRGKKTRQYNPQGKPIATLAAWMEAVKRLHGGDSTFTLADAIASVRATPADQRSDFAREIWRRRRARGTARPVPF